MHISPPAPALSQASALQHSGSRSANTVFQKVQEVSPGPVALRLEHLAARQVGPALACRRVNELVEAGQMELYPGFRELLLLLDQGRVVQKGPAAEPTICLLGTITHVLLGHVAGERLPAVQEQTALCSFLYTLDRGNRCALQLTEQDPFMALAQQQDSGGHSLLYLAVYKELIGLVEWLLNSQPESFSATAPFTGENDERTNPLLLR